MIVTGILTSILKFTPIYIKMISAEENMVLITIITLLLKLLAISYSFN